MTVRDTTSCQRATDVTTGSSSAATNAQPGLSLDQSLLITAGAPTAAATMETPSTET